METRAARDVSSIREEASTLLRQAANVEADLRSVTRDIARLLRGPMSPDAVAKDENVPEHVAPIGPQSVLEFLLATQSSVDRMDRQLEVLRRIRDDLAPNAGPVEGPRATYAGDDVTAPARQAGNAPPRRY
jgi:hypothetical protein